MLLLTLFPLQIDTSRHLEWLKGLEASHGSVAKSSLKEAKAINEYGVYCVGCVSKDVEKSTETLTLDAVIQLKLLRDEKIITLDDLKDLQSKLMLIASKASHGKEDVDRFVDVSLVPKFQANLGFFPYGQSANRKPWFLRFQSYRRRSLYLF